VSSDFGKLPADLIELGRIAEPYGIKGWVNVHPHSDHGSTLKQAKRWFLHWPSSGNDRTLHASLERVIKRPAGQLAPAGWFEVTVAEGRMHSGRLVAHLVGIEDRTPAEALKGAQVWVSRSLFPPLKKGEFYWVDLVGLAVVNREGLTLGTVTEVMDHGAHPILCIAPPPKPADEAASPAEKDAGSDSGSDSEECLIPFVPAYIDEVALQDRCIRVDWQPDY